MKSKFVFFAIVLVCCLLCGCGITYRWSIQNKSEAEIVTIAPGEMRKVSSSGRCYIKPVYYGDFAIVSRGCVYTYPFSYDRWNRYLKFSSPFFWSYRTLTLVFDDNAKLIGGSAANGFTLEPKNIMPIFPDAPWDLKQMRRKK